MSRVLIINGNPKSSSLCRALAERYRQIAEKEHDVQVLHVSELNFELDLQQGYDEIQALEPDLENTQQLVTWAEHIVLITPVWWGSMPARLKGLFDRILLPGYAFKYVEGKAWPKQLLKGRTSELVVTLDTPVWWHKWFQGNPMVKQLKHTILEFVGIKVRSVRYFGPVMNAKEEQIERWINSVQRLAVTLPASHVPAANGTSRSGA
ncbi:NAD(P)H dehydrogenase [Bacterioplanes sanyensis]|uniref:NAD(P)H dehydrogenase n=1 Tax=Bacterioplanes sanyensis TaxID=1249553 RepID=A0A222FP95_9GAMM|nr:NAD(P)H-dependent oxidoreductase [Bacterioplanes sanyensis]ASP40356.1 NAD(P)H dehydrogenase [Bacterioplanes sanyensis]